MTEQKNLMMDRAVTRLEKVRSFIDLVLKYSRDLQEPELLRVLETGDKIPFDLLTFIFDTVVQPELGNIITPAFRGNWRIIAEREGVIVPQEDRESG